MPTITINLTAAQAQRVQRAYQELKTPVELDENQNAVPIAVTVADVRTDLVEYLRSQVFRGEWAIRQRQIAEAQDDFTLE
jgi:anti-sigma28 factor (negative regulator of flagellin synthesis)